MRRRPGGRARRRGDVLARVDERTGPSGNVAGREIHMKVTWLAQAGLLFENGHLSVMVDPYFSDSAGERDASKHRRMAANDAFLRAPDVLIITHDHLDHLDPATLCRLLDTERRITVLASEGAYAKLCALGFPQHRYVLMRPHSVWSEGSVTFYAVKAEHSDPHAIGCIIDDGNRTYYVTGDTLYNYDVLDDVLDLVEDGVDVVFLPINGEGNNMNAKDAADFAYEIDAARAVPIHYGLFDGQDPSEFDFENAVLLKPFVPFEF